MTETEAKSARATATAATAKRDKLKLTFEAAKLARQAADDAAQSARDAYFAACDATVEACRRANIAEMAVNQRKADDASRAGGDNGMLARMQATDPSTAGAYEARRVALAAAAKREAAR
jgi:hypothetical protein